MTAERDSLAARREEKALREWLLRIYREARAKDDGARMPRRWVRPRETDETESK